MLGDPDVILPGCYYPGCEDEHEPAKKFCATHGGNTKMKKPAKAPAVVETAEPVETQKTSAKAAKSKPKKKAAKSKPKKKGTPAQLAAAQAAKGFDRIDWSKEISQFLGNKQHRVEFELSTPGSAQVTRVRLLKRGDTKGLTIRTRGTWIEILKKGAE